MTTIDHLPAGRGRILAVAYGLVSYLAFLAVFLYMIGFVGDLVVPRTIDTGPSAPVALALVVDTVLVLLFAVPHSVMARPGFKRWWTQYVPKAVERSTFVLTSSLLLGLLYWQWRPIPSVIWSVDNPAGRWLLLAIFAAGWALVFISSLLIDHFDLFGLRQVYLHATGRAYTPPTFQVHGLYRVVRHPLMTGFLLAFWATPRMTTGHLLLAILLTSYILIAVPIEERDMAAHHGDEYRAYQKQTSMFLPRHRRSRSSTTAPR